MQMSSLQSLIEAQKLAALWETRCHNWGPCLKSRRFPKFGLNIQNKSFCKDSIFGLPKLQIIFGLADALSCSAQLMSPWQEMCHILVRLMGGEGCLRCGRSQELEQGGTRGAISGLIYNPATHFNCTNFTVHCSVPLFWHFPPSSFSCCTRAETAPPQPPSEEKGESCHPIFLVIKYRIRQKYRLHQLFRGDFSMVCFKQHEVEIKRF